MEPDLPSTEMVGNGTADAGPCAGCFHGKAQRRTPVFLLNSVKLGYRYLVNSMSYLLAIPVVAATASLDDPWTASVAFLSGMILLFLAAYAYVRLRPRPIYLVDFACYSPPQHLQITRAEFVKLAERSGQFDDVALEFQRRTLEDSGIGDESCMPRTVFSPGERVVLREGREEAAIVMFGSIDHLLAATRIKATDIKILVVNCGVLNTTPSLSAMIVNHYKLKPDVISYNLGGMGCAAGGIAVDLAGDLLASHTASSALGLGAYALVVSAEIVSSTWYGGNDLDMLLPNCYLRMGAAALLLSNRRLERRRGKYELKRVVRAHMGGSMDERSFRWVELGEDRAGRMGLRLVRDKHRLLEIGGQAVEANMKTLGLKEGGRLGLEHVCVQASSKAVLEEVQRRLGLREEYMEASRRTLERFGNTSSSSVWYELALLEAEGRVEAGDAIWQVAVGSGFKCTGMVWTALRRPKPASAATNPWIPPHP